jgi:hypothetical protein
MVIGAAGFYRARGFSLLARYGMEWEGEGGAFNSHMDRTSRAAPSRACVIAPLCLEVRKHMLRRPCEVIDLVATPRF